MIYNRKDKMPALGNGYVMGCSIIIIIPAKTYMLLLCARYCFKFFSYVNLFICHTNPMRKLRYIPRLN